MLLKKITLLLVAIIFTVQNFHAQWKNKKAENIKNDIVITYDVIYENELTEKQKKSSSYTREIVVTFNKDKVVERRFKNSLKTQYFSIYDYNQEKGYNCIVSGSSKSAISFDFKPPFKETTLQGGAKKDILGLNCDAYITVIKGKPYKIYTTDKFGLRYIKHYNTQGFLMDYVMHDKYLGTYRVVAKKINFFKMPSSIYSLEGFKIQTQKEYANARKEFSNRYEQIYKKMIGSKAPRFRFRTLSGEKISSKNTLGKVVVMNYWFTTCPPCKAEIPHLNKLKQEFADDPNVVFLAVALDDDSRLDNFLKKTKFDYGIASDGKFDAKLFNIPAYPTNILIDKNGVIQYYKVGGLSGSKVKELSYKIEDLLEAPTKS